MRAGCAAPAAACPNGGVSIGACVNALCAIGYECLNDQCCPAANPPVQTGFQPTPSDHDTTRHDVASEGCPAGQTDLGPCVSGLCGIGATCVSDRCCQLSNQPSIPVITRTLHRPFTPTPMRPMRPYKDFVSNVYPTLSSPSKSSINLLLHSTSVP